MFKKSREPDRKRSDLHILVMCGIGDIISYLARLDSLLIQHNHPRAYFYVGGHAQIPELIAEVLHPDRRVYGCHILYGYTQGSVRRQKIRLRRIKRNSFPGDIIVNWVPDESKIPFKMTYPFTPALFPEDHASAEDFLQKNNLRNGEAFGIHPITTRGNAGGFEEKRYWPQEKWHALVDYLLHRGERLLLFGAEGEEYGLPVNGKTIISAQGLPIRTTIALLLRVKGLIGTNSWCWEVVAYAGKPIIALWFTSPQNIRLYVPPVQDHTRFFTDKSVTVDEVLSAYQQLWL